MARNRRAESARLRAVEKLPREATDGVDGPEDAA
jgi:hypothetical protein